MNAPDSTIPANMPPSISAAPHQAGQMPARRTQEPSSAWPVRFVDVARESGLTQPITYGDPARKRFIIETNGCGVAMIDVDDDGWVDLVTLNGHSWNADEGLLTGEESETPRIPCGG